jgi:2-methylisocitrate lyase-like PEP mutase family enzyme
VQIEAEIVPQPKLTIHLSIKHIIISGLNNAILYSSRTRDHLSWSPHSWYTTHPYVIPLFSPTTTTQTYLSPRNVYDAVSARTVASLPLTQALASASFAVAQASGVDDAALSLEANIAGARTIAAVAKEFNLPLTVDFQDGYGEDLQQGIEKLIDLGVVGINLEDRDKDTNEMTPLEVATERIRRVLAVAARKGVPDFVVNARCDSLFAKGSLSEVITRGKAYLEAGATTVFVWGGQERGGITKDEVAELVGAFEGRLNVSLLIDGVRGKGGLTVKELSKLGVARISVGPQLQLAAMKKLKEEAEKLLASR